MRQSSRCLTRTKCVIRTPDVVQLVEYAKLGIEYDKHDALMDRWLMVQRCILTRVALLVR